MRITEEKAKRIAVGATIAGVLVLLFLLITMIYQFVRLGIQSAEKAELEQKIERLEQEIQTGEKDFAYYSKKQTLENLARQYGYKHATDK